MKYSFVVELEAKELTVSELQMYVEASVNPFYDPSMERLQEKAQMEISNIKVSVCPPLKQIKREDAVQYIKESGGKFISLKFIKRTDGELREMLARTGVKKGIVENPKKPGLDFEKNNLIPVFDVQKDQYRSIPEEGLVAILIDGVWNQVI